MTDLLSIADVARVTGLTRETIRVYRCRGQMPEPTEVIDNKPLWSPDVIAEWSAGRHKPGRPRKVS